MPRRRMIDPIFWNDRKVGKLSRDGRSLIVGCVGQADDDGRLQADPAFLKASMYKYDDDLDTTAVKELRDKCLSEMSTWPATHPYRMVLYQSSDEEYIFFPNWNATNRPSHPSKSQLPPPPPESLPILSGTTPEELSKPSALGQSSLGKDSIGQVRAVQEDFANIFDENDLTDRLTRTLTEYMARGPTWAVGVLKRFWKARVGVDMSDKLFQVSYEAVKKYPAPVLARSFVKAAKYKGGRFGSAKYIQKILDEQASLSTTRARPP